MGKGNTPLCSAKPEQSRKTRQIEPQTEGSKQNTVTTPPRSAAKQAKGLVPTPSTSPIYKVLRNKTSKQYQNTVQF